MKTLLLSIFISFSVFAGEKGNGGDAVVCRSANGEIISVELLDYYEGRVVRRLPTLDHPELSDDQILEKISEKLTSFESGSARYNLKEAKALSASITEFLATGSTTNEKILFTEDTLTDIPDSNELIIKKGCEVEQLAIWKEAFYPEDPHFIIQSQLLKKLSPRDVRGLVLHETLYKFLFYRNKWTNLSLNDSIPVRYLHQKLMSKAFDSFKFADYMEFLQNMALAMGSDKAFLTKESKHARKRLSLSYAYVSDDRKMTTMKDIDSGAHFVLDENGEFSVPLTREYGCVEVSAYFLPNPIGQNYGEVVVNGENLRFYDAESDRTTCVKFGEAQLVVKLTDLIPRQSEARMWGISTVLDNNKIEHFGVTVAPRETKREFQVTFYNVINDYMSPSFCENPHCMGD